MRSGTPVAYIDRNQRYRFVNKALLDWFGKRDRRGPRPRGHRGDRPRDLPALSRLHRSRARRRAHRLRAAARVPGSAADLDPRRLLPRSQTSRATSAAFSRRTATSTTSSGSSSKPGSASIACGSSPTASACRSSTSTASCGCALPTSRSATGSACRPTISSAMRCKDFLPADALDRDAGLHRARVRRRDGGVRAARAPRSRRAALGAHHAVPRPRDGRPRRRRVRGDGTTSRTTSASARR